MAELRYREALNAALREELRRDERVLLMGEDIGVFGGAFKVTDGLLDEFGERRVRDTPISENTIVGMGVGAAMAGLRPVVELMTINFALLAFDQIVNHAAHDDMKYVPKEQVEEWRKRDPVERQENRLRELGVDVDAVRASVQAEIDAATEEALASPMPDPALVVEGVFCAGEAEALGDGVARWSGFTS